MVMYRKCCHPFPAARLSHIVVGLDLTSPGLDGYSQLEENSCG